MSVGLHRLFFISNPELKNLEIVDAETTVPVALQTPRWYPRQDVLGLVWCMSSNMKASRSDIAMEPGPEGMSLSLMMTAGSITRPAHINSPSIFRIVFRVTLHSLANAEMLGRTLLLVSLAFKYAEPIVTFSEKESADLLR